MPLTKAQRLVLQDFKNAETLNKDDLVTAYQLAVSPNVVKTLYEMGFLKAVKWAKFWNDTAMVITPAGHAELLKD